MLNIVSFSQKDSPSTTTLCALGVYLIVSLFYVFGAMVQYSVVLCIMRCMDNDKNREDKIEPAIIKVGNPPRSAEQVQTNSASTKKKNQRTEGVDLKRICRILDFASFFIFSISFAIFNAYYWSQYV